MFAPASWCCPFPAKAIEIVTPRAPSPRSKIDGYFIVNFEPIFPSIHSMSPFSSTVARFVTKLYTLFDQFWIVVYRQLRSEEHTSELQSRGHLVCRLLLEKKKR